ncbi:tetratricopeptide repeat protein [uncultured Selenomonas sp.]|uniref:tetratricopeptide repeat protein n=1 Tax=uncultured Selenomonas sp. TaxID=159275 RepID=UPI0025EAEC97|nr:tetratricopeptide repeat protein [uncultured Selenomonas sp.]
MKKRKRNRAERARKKRARREEKRQMKGTMTMAEKKNITAEQIHAYVKKEKYAEAINAFADALAQGEPPKECYADVARAYFELGDYKRAADWVSNALSVDPGNVDMRILLARICQRERRTDDALKLYENILAAHTAALTATQRAEIKQRAGLDARLAQDKTRTAYPHLAALLGLAPAPAASTAQTVPAAPAVSAAAPIAPVSVPAAPAVQSAGNAKVQAAQILAQSIRPAEKMAALNAFAGAAYVQDDYAGARELLTAALELDPGCDVTLRNMALLLHEIGEREKALQVAAKMGQTDFMLLRTLKS